MKYRDLSHEDRLIRVAEMYYLEGMSQQEIADTIHTSRSNVARFLKICTETGIVEFKIKKVSSDVIRIQSKLESRFRLDKVIIVPSSGTVEQVKCAVGAAAAEYLESIVCDNMLIGTSWGTTLYQVAVQYHSERRVKADTIQFVGGVNPRYSDTDGQEIVRRLHANFDGSCYLLHAPMIVGSREFKQMLLEEPDIKGHFEQMGNTDVALLGIGFNRHSQSALYRAGHITKQEADEMVRRGAIGDICGIQFDIDGNICETSLFGRVIGIGMETLREIPVRIGVCNGTEKAGSAMGALRGGFINILVIDEETGKRILDLS